MIHPLDILLVVHLLVVAPLLAARGYRALLRDIEAGKAAARLRAYRSNVLSAWALCLALLVWWWQVGRSAEGIGFVLPLGAKSFVGLAVTLLALGLMLVQWRQVLRLEGDALNPLRAQMEAVAGLMPHTAVEYRWWRAISITAGVCEEVLYRGFLMWFLGHWMSPWVAAFVAGAAFGVGHVYQGPSGMLKTGVIGVLAGLLYAGTGSLLWPIILHTAVDLQGGAVARRVLASAN
jgi:membrane protease YdiL (CAAX protease family)